MKEEGFVNLAFNKIKEKEMNARFIANQACYNGPDTRKLDFIAKAPLYVALSVMNDGFNDLDTCMKNLEKAKILKEGKEVVDKALKIINNREKIIEEDED